MSRFALILVALAALSLITAPVFAHDVGHFGHNHFGHSHFNGFGYNSWGGLHYHNVYHPTYSHWTPNQGWHTHGHYHTVPHFTW